MKRILFLAFVALFLTADAHAKDCRPTTINTSGGALFTTQDISGGAVTTGEIGAGPGSTVKFSFDLVDASDGITNLAFSFTESKAVGGTFRPAAWCAAVGDTWTCGKFTINWDPQNASDGKTGSLYVPWAYALMKITVTHLDPIS